MKHLPKEIDYDHTVESLRRAGKIYRSTRGRAGLYDFLDQAYKTFRAFRKLKRLGFHKKSLRGAADLPVDKSRKLADLVLTISAATRDRRERHRWKRLIEAAYSHKVETHLFRRQLHALHGVNNALSYWLLPPQPPLNPGDQLLPGMEGIVQSAMYIPYDVDGE